MLIHIPRVEPLAWLVSSEQDQSRLKLSCDTVVLRADERELHLIWRCAIPSYQADRGWVVINPPRSDEPEQIDTNDREQAT